MRQSPRILAATIALLLLLPVSEGLAYTITFDDLSDLDAVTTQYAGVTFSGATVLTAGISLNEFEFPPFSGSNVVFDDGGPITLAFSAPVFDVGGYFTYLSPVTLSAYDASASLLGSISSAYLSNLALSGDIGSNPNEFLHLAFAGGISTVVITGDPVGGSFALDDITVNPVGVPEPTTFLLLASGFLFLLAMRRSQTATF